MKIFIYPILLLIFCFAVDKIFLLEDIQKRAISWKRFEKAAYETRGILFDLLKKDYYENPNKNYYLLLGSSRTAQMKRLQIETAIPNSAFYNFAVPYPGISYQYFWLEKILDAGIKLQAIILELDALLLTGTAFQYSISYLFDFSYIWRNSTLQSFYDGERGFSKKEIFQFVKTRLFTISRYPFSWEAVLDNRKKFTVLDNGQIREIEKKELIPKSREALIGLIYENHGGINTIPGTARQMDFQKEAKEKWEQYFFVGNFPSPPQLYFLSKLLQKATQENIPVLLLVPQTSIEFSQILRNSMVKTEFQRTLEKILQEHPQIKVLDLQNERPCRDFEDSFHVAENCISDFTTRVLQLIPRK